MLIAFMDMIDSPEGQSQFEQLYYKYRKLMFFVANGILRDHQLAEDAVSEAFFRIAKSFDRIVSKIAQDMRKNGLEEDNSTKSIISCPHMKRFVVIVVRNISYDMQKRAYQMHEISTDDAILDSVRDIADRCDSTELRCLENCEYNEVLSIINELSSKYRDALYLYAVEGYSIGETAEIMGITYDTVKKRLQRARLQLEEKKRQKAQKEMW